MSVSSKSIDKNKRYAGIKTNDFVNKTRSNETSRATARTQGWANLGKINSRRIPPPANLPSLKSETGTNPPAFDPTIPTGTSHGWTSASGNQTPSSQTRPLTPSKQPTQQQLDSLPAHAATPPLTQTTDLDKPRSPATWSNITAGNPAESTAPPSLLGLNDFPRLATQESKSVKSTADALISSINTNNQGPSFRPANLASWKEGGGRAQPIANDGNENSPSMQSQTLPPSATTTNSNTLQSQTQNSSSYTRMYQPQQQQQQQQQQMWSYNMNHPYGSNQYRVSSYHSNNQSQSQQQQQQRLHQANDYKTPTILRNKDIDDLSKLTDNVTWASASQEVNYEEKIRFSDDEDNDVAESNNKSSARRFNHHSQQSTHRANYPPSSQNTHRAVQNTRSRLLQDDEHVKQLQDDKNSELINVLTVARQRRDEQQERPHREHRSATTPNEQKQIPGYQTRPLLSSTGQENLPSNQIDSASSLWTQTGANTATTTAAATAPVAVPTARTRHDTTDSQTFAMKSWSDQMDSFNYASLHEKANAQAEPDDEKPSISIAARKFSRSPSESSSQSQSDILSRSNQSKHFPLPPNRKAGKPTATNPPPPKSKTTDVSDYFEQSNTDQWNNNDWEETNQRYQQTYNNDRRRQQTSEDSTHKSTRFNEQTNDYNRTKPAPKTRAVTSSRSTDIPSLTAKLETKASSAKAQPAWRTLSPTRPADSADPTPQEAIQYKPAVKPTEIPDRRQSAPTERKPRYTTTATPINTASIPPLMSVRSDLPPPTLSTTSKQYKAANQSQRSDYNASSHYSQRNDFYNDNADSAWANDDEYYDDETGYYDSNLSTHQRSMGYQTHLHHRGYTTLGSYGRYRRGGTLRHQQQYNTYNLNTASNGAAQLNTSAGAKTKKILTNRTTTKKPTEPSEVVKPAEEAPKVTADEPVKKPSAWAVEPKPAVSTVEEIPIIKSTETPAGTEKANDLLPEPKLESEVAHPEQTAADTAVSSNKKSTPTSQQRKTAREPQSYYQNQQTTRHRNTYSRSMQDYDDMQLSSQNYFGTARRARGARAHHLSSNYYYEHPQQRYSSRYSYSTEPYHQSHPIRSSAKPSKRGQSTTATNDRPSASNSASTHLQKESVSDNEQKEGEEWETASESSANMRPVHHEANQQISKSTAETKTTTQDRTPPKKSFASQRPINSRHTESALHRRSHNLHDRAAKSTRGARPGRLLTAEKFSHSQNTEDESSTARQSKKDQHRHSLDGYDLNNVAGVVKIETLPAGALEEESTAFDDGGEEFCVVMSKRGRKEQKAAQLSKQNAADSPSVEPSSKSNSIETDSQQAAESTKSAEASAARARSGKSLPPRFNSKSSARPSKADQMYYYDQNYYYYDQNQYYDENSYYNYNNYNQSHRQSSTRRKQRTQQPSTQQPQQQQQQPQQQQEQAPATQELNLEEKKPETEKLGSNVMSNIQMWNPHAEHKLSSSSKLIEKPVHDRKYTNEIEGSLPLQLTTHSPVSKTNENLARAIKPPGGENKTDQKMKSANYEKNDTISSLGSNQLFEKSTFLDYDDKQSIGTVGDDYNQKINSLKTIWDISDHPSGQLEQTINSMVAMQQQQENNVQTGSSTKSDNYAQESIPTSSSTTNANVSSAASDEANTKNSSSNANASAGTMNPSTNYSANSNTNKNEQKNICTVKPTQQVPPNIQDQVDVNAYQTFPVPPLPPPMSQASLQQQQQQHLLPQSQVNALHQQHSYPFYENLLPPPPQQQAQQQPYNRYPPQNFPYRSTNVYMQAPPPPNVPNTNSMYHHTSQGSISAPPQNNAMPPMPSYPSPFLLDHGGHMMSQPQPPPPPPPQAYMNNQMMSGRPQGGPYYRTPPQQQLQTPPGPPPYGTQDPLAHGGYYPPFFQPPNSNAPPVGHPSPHNLYGQNEGFHPAHPPMFARGGSIDRADHPLMSQPLSRPTSYPSTPSSQPLPPPPQQQGPPPSLLSQNLKAFHTNQQQTSSSNQPSFYPPPPPPNQYNRQAVPIGAMNANANRQQAQQVPSLMSGLTKNFANNASNMPNTQALFPHRQPLLPPQSANNRPLYQHHNQYSSYPKTNTTNDDNVKTKHI